MPVPITLAVHSNGQLAVYKGQPDFGQIHLLDSSKTCKSAVFSPLGDYLAYIVESKNVCIVETVTWTKKFTISTLPMAQNVCFSPKGTYLIVWHKSINEVPHNLYIFFTENGSLINSYPQRNDIYWQPQWTQNESILSVRRQKDIVFYKNGNFEQFSEKLVMAKGGTFSLAPHSSDTFVLCFNKAARGQPSVVRLFKYGEFAEDQTVCSKSFFQADEITANWHPAIGGHCLLHTTTEVDSTGQSYYGRVDMYYINASRGQIEKVSTGSRQQRNGPMLSAAWHPARLEFCLVYGHQPASATIFNEKLEVISECGSSVWNTAVFNPHGNLLLLGGFSQLTGQIHLWDVEERRFIGQCVADNTTFLQWSPTGEHFVTATTSPRLRVDNGWTIWHYTGVVCHRFQSSSEVYHVFWCNVPPDTFAAPQISLAEGGKVSDNPAEMVTCATKEVYRPPALRNRPILAREEFVKPVSKNKKKREQKKLKAKTVSEETTENSSTACSQALITLTGDTVKDKQLRNIKKKLDDIEKLKEKMVQGVPLQKNQLEKIKTEVELMKKMEELQLTFSNKCLEN